MNATEKLAYLKSIEGLPLKGIAVKLTVDDKTDVPDFLRIEFTSQAMKIFPSVVQDLQKTLAPSAKLELKAEIARVEKLLEALKKQLEEVKGDKP